MSEFCNRAILLEKGQIISQGQPAEVVDLYRERVAQHKLLAEESAKRFASVPRVDPAASGSG